MATENRAIVLRDGRRLVYPCGDPQPRLIDQYRGISEAERLRAGFDDLGVMVSIGPAKGDLSQVTLWSMRDVGKRLKTWNPFGTKKPVWGIDHVGYAKVE